MDITTLTADRKQVRRSPSHTRLWQTVFPNRAMVFFCGAGIAIEVLLAWRVPTHALWAGGAAEGAAICFLLWFWLTLAYGLRGLRRGWGRAKVDRGWRGVEVIRVAGIVMGLASLGVGYTISWGLFLQTGRFANMETLWFAWVNHEMLWDYLRAADQRQLCGIAVAALAWPCGIVWWGRKLEGDERASGVQQQYRLRPLMLWLTLGMATLWLRGKICDDLSVPRQVDRMHRLATAMNPAVSILSSVWLHWTAEPIRPCLDATQLVRRAELAAVDRGQHEAPSVIVIAIESLRHDMIGRVHQGREILPNINRLAAQGMHLTRAYAQSTHSDYADVCLVSSLYPLRSRSHHFYRRDDPWPKQLLHDVLKEYGYSTAIISSQNEAWGGMDQFLQTPSLDLFYHPQTSSEKSMVSERDPGFWREHMAGTLVAGKFPDGHTTDVALRWIADQREAGRRFCLSMNFQSSHFPYLLPEGTPQPFQPAALADDVKFSSYPVERTANVRNAYYNAIHECDRQVGRVVQQLEELGLEDNTILVVTGENGEAFHEAGCVGHAGLPVEPVVHVAAVIHGPGRVPQGAEDYPLEHVDLVPTLLGLMRLPSHDNFQGLDIRQGDRPDAAERLLYFHVISPIARADAVLLGGRWKWMISHDHPRGVLYDIENDRSESRDLQQQYPELAGHLQEVLHRWRCQQLAYYYYPEYYLRYYPPRAPRWPANGAPKIGQ